LIIAFFSQKIPCIHNQYYVTVTIEKDDVMILVEVNKPSDIFKCIVTLFEIVLIDKDRRLHYLDRRFCFMVACILASLF
jgi:hypothetical protein